jgi:hypothetical protein
MQQDLLQTDWSLLDPKVTRHGYQEMCIRRDLTRSIGGLIPDIEVELQESVVDLWGDDTESWNDVCVSEKIMKVVARISNQVFVGLPLCKVNI